MLKNEMESYVRLGGGVWKILCTLKWGRGVKACQNHPYVINEWPLIVICKNLILCIISHLNGCTPSLKKPPLLLILGEYTE